MDGFVRLMSNLRTVFWQITQTGFVFVAFVVLVYLLLGENSGDYVISVIANLSIMVNVVTPQVLGAIGLGLALLFIVRGRGRGGDESENRVDPGDGNP